MPGLVWESYWDALPALRAERALEGAQIAVLPHLKRNAAGSVTRAWSRAIAEYHRVTADVREVMAWLGSGLGSGLGR